ncbi:MAG: hypothetical protein ACTSW1_16090 [Candidatus Hodarchaeales archaeon]
MSKAKLSEKISVIIAIPLVVLGLVFMVAASIFNNNVNWFYSIGEVGGALYFRARTEEAFYNAVFFFVVAAILLAYAYYQYRQR